MKQKMKRTLSFVLVTAMIFSMIPFEFSIAYAEGTSGSYSSVFAEGFNYSTYFYPESSSSSLFEKTDAIQLPNGSFAEVPYGVTSLGTDVGETHLLKMKPNSKYIKLKCKVKFEWKASTEWKKEYAANCCMGDGSPDYYNKEAYYYKPPSSNFYPLELSTFGESHLMISTYNGQSWTNRFTDSKYGGNWYEYEVVLAPSEADRTISFTNNKDDGATDEYSNTQYGYKAVEALAEGARMYLADVKVEEIPNVNLTVTKSADGGTVEYSLNKTDYQALANIGNKFEYGKEITLKAAPTINTSWRFNGWKVGNSYVSKDLVYTTQLTKDTAIVADFENYSSDIDDYMMDVSDNNILKNTSFTWNVIDGKVKGWLGSQAGANATGVKGNQDYLTTTVTIPSSGANMYFSVEHSYGNNFKFYVDDKEVSSYNYGVNWQTSDVNNTQHVNYWLAEGQHKISFLGEECIKICNLGFAISKCKLSALNKSDLEKYRVFIFEGSSEKEITDVLRFDPDCSIEYPFGTVIKLKYRGDSVKSSEKFRFKVNSGNVPLSYNYTIKNSDKISNFTDYGTAQFCLSSDSSIVTGYEERESAVKYIQKDQSEQFEWITSGLGDHWVGGEVSGKPYYTPQPDGTKDNFDKWLSTSVNVEPNKMYYVSYEWAYSYKNYAKDQMQTPKLKYSTIKKDYIRPSDPSFDYNYYSDQMAKEPMKFMTVSHLFTSIDSRPITLKWDVTDFKTMVDDYDLNTIYLRNFTLHEAKALKIHSQTYYKDVNGEIKPFDDDNLYASMDVSVFRNGKSGQKVDIDKATVFDTIIVTANLAPEGYSFAGWIDESLTEANSKKTTYEKRILAEEDQEIKALYVISGGGATVDEVNKTIYANGTPVLVYKNYIYYDRGTIGAYDANIDEKIMPDSCIDYTLYGGAMGEGRISSTKITVIDSKLNKSLYGGGKQSTISGNSDIVIKNSTFVADVYGGGYDGVVEGNVNISILNDSASSDLTNTKTNINTIYGGGYGANVIGKSTILVEGTGSDIEIENIIDGEIIGKPMDADTEIIVKSGKIKNLTGNDRVRGNTKVTVTGADTIVNTIKFEKDPAFSTTLGKGNITIDVKDAKISTINCTDKGNTAAVCKVILDIDQISNFVCTDEVEVRRFFKSSIYINPENGVAKPVVLGGQIAGMKERYTFNQNPSNNLVEFRMVDNASCTIDGDSIYANGSPVLIYNNKLYLDNGSIGVKDEADEEVKNAGTPFDFSRPWKLFGGSKDGRALNSTRITVLTTEELPYYIYGGSFSGNVENTLIDIKSNDISGKKNIGIRYIYGSGAGGSGEIKNAKIQISSAQFPSYIKLYDVGIYGSEPSNKQHVENFELLVDYAEISAGYLDAGIHCNSGIIDDAKIYITNSKVGHINGNNGSMTEVGTKSTIVVKNSETGNIYGCAKNSQDSTNTTKLQSLTIDLTDTVVNAGVMPLKGISAGNYPEANIGSYDLKISGKCKIDTVWLRPGNGSIGSINATIDGGNIYSGLYTDNYEGELVPVSGDMNVSINGTTFGKTIETVYREGIIYYYSGNEVKGKSELTLNDVHIDRLQIAGSKSEDVRTDFNIVNFNSGTINLINSAAPEGVNFAKTRFNYNAPFALNEDTKTILIPYDNSVFDIHGNAKYYCPDLEEGKTYRIIVKKIVPVLSKVGIGVVNGTSIPLSFKSDKKGKYYILTQKSDAPEPTEQQVIDNNTATGSITEAFTLQTVNVTVLGGKGKYKAYVVAKDSEDNNSVVYKTGEFNIEKQAISLSNVEVDNKTYDGNSAELKNEIIAKNSSTQETVSIPEGDFNCTYYQKTAAGYDKLVGAPKDVGEYKLVVLIAEKNSEYMGTSEDVIFSIEKAKATVTGITGISRQYNGDTAVEVDITSAQLKGVLEADKNGVSLDKSEVTATADKNAGTDKAVTLLGNLKLAGDRAVNYELEAPKDIKVNITKADLNVKSATAKNKKYDNKTDAEISAVEFEGLVTDEILEITKDYTASANFSDKVIGNDKVVTGTVSLLDTVKAGNYTLNNANINTTASVTSGEGLEVVSSPSNISAVCGTEKTYTVDLQEIKFNKENLGTLSYSLVSVSGYDVLSENPTVTGNSMTLKTRSTSLDGQYATITVKADTENYGSVDVQFKISITAKKQLTVSGINVQSKKYDGDKISCTGTISAKDDKLQTVLIPEGDFNCMYYQKNAAGYDKLVGAPKDVGEYKLVVSIAETNIEYMGTSEDVIFSIEKAKATVTGITGTSRQYNGEIAVELDVTSAQLKGVLEADKNGVSLDKSEVTATADKNAGTDKAVTLSGNLKLVGDRAVNYELEAPQDIKVNITMADLIVKSATAKNKKYDNKTDAEISAVEFEGLITGEILEITKDYTVSANFLDKKLGNNKEVRGTVSLLDTLKVRNYMLNNTNIVTIADIVAADGLSVVTSPSAISVVAGVEKTYTVDLDKTIELNQEEPGTVTYALLNLEGDSIFTNEPELNGKQLKFTTTASAISGQIATQTVNVSTSNYGSLTATVKISVTDKENVTITGINIESKTYDANPAQYTGTPATDGGKTDKFTIGWIDVQNSKTLSEAPVDAGKYKLIVSVDSSDENYMGKSEYAFEIKAKEVKAKPETVTIVQGDNLPKEFIVTYEGLLGSDKIIWDANPYYEIRKADGTALENSSAEGTYAVKWTNASVMTQQNANYNVLPQDGVLIINKKSIGGGDSGGGNSPGKPEVAADENKEDAKPGENTQPNDSAEKFSDIENHWAKEAIESVASLGLLKGTSENKFEPEKATTRAMIVTVLYRISGMPEHDKDTGSISDVKEGSYYYDAVIWAKQLGIISGFEDGSFRPDEKLDREQMAVIIYNYIKKEKAKLTAGEKSHFTDEVQIAEWAQEAIEFCTEQGLLNGRTDGTFDPHGNATRAEAAVIVKRLLEAIEK